MLLTAFIILGGVQKGIEKASKSMMPILFLIIIALCINSINLPNASKGLKFLFYPDFSAITSQSILSALGQSFFSLSIGMGGMLTYASYLSPKDNLSTTSLKVILMDTGIAILAGIAIIPAVFAFDINPEAGPGLAFLTLPQVFQQLPGGEIWAILFFILLTCAALTSAISLLEVPVLYLMEEKGMKRSTATIIITLIITTLGILCTLSFGPLRTIQVFGLNIFEIFDYIASNILLPSGGILLCIFTGWYMDKSILKSEISNQGTFKIRFFKLYSFIIKYIAPLSILFILLNVIGII
jgi:NSS family neurotransmitter:Na+ symporter